jgi:WD40 repeat protein/energy-coupling factor transporter ATP-binding protein EcfA2
MSENSICPYPGLRPFNERESIYFKGRDEQIKKIVTQLQEKKFLMVTGASGDGKSSLVYAGLIPHAKAGFFKARFNNWIVADFRPEKTPFKNIIQALSILKPGNEKQLAKELNYGFSALVDEYKSSPFYIDTEGQPWLQSDEASQKEQEKKGANLLIIADQFEEFFTNPENYSNDQVSIESQKVMNLLLETAAIAKKENIPIYIVCTMRADYIGQCACFRGLPEAIGDSQFFVPRLKREEIQQVIEGPAQLNGNKISRRLTQKLLNILPPGFDQLPLLQHALHQIWKMAENGKVEMDSIHLAMIGGISPKQLIPSDKALFNTWYASLPDFNKKLLESPSMGNILNAHAKEMFESAVEYLKGHYKIDISKEKANTVVQIAFSSLTKIDAQRAVRNRLTLQEITNIINLPEINTNIVGGLLDVFRLQGSTFLRPFIDESNQRLNPNDILDITHESLIRNWDILKKWTDLENENYQTFLDFNKQLNRWITNQESKDYLLPNGPLTFFEQWYERCKPNKYWLLKHDENKAKYNDSEIKAATDIEAIKRFLKESRNAIMKKRRVLIFATITLICLLSGFTVWAVVERNKAINHEQMADRLAKESLLSKEEALRSREKAIESEKLANKARQQSKQNEQIAIEAGKKSKINEIAALLAKEDALKAQDEALKSKSNAIQETKNAQQQRLIAEMEKIKAEKAEKKSGQLTVLSIAQNMALKSVLLPGQGNHDLQALLALQAFRFTKEKEGDVQDPAIYGAVLTSYLALTKNKFSVFTGSQAEIKAMALREDGNLLTAGNDGKINTWDQKAGQISNSIELKFKSPINYISFSKNGNMVFTGHENKTVCLWDVAKEPGKALATELKGFKGYVNDIKISPDGKIVAAVGRDSLLIIWDLSTAKIKNTYNLKSLSRALLFLPDGSSIVTANDDGSIKKIELSDGNIKELSGPTNGTPLSLAMAPNKKTIIAGFSSGKIKLYDLKKPELKFHQLNDPDPLIDVEKITLNSSESLMAVASSDKRIKIYFLDFPDHKPLLLKDQKSKIKSFLFSDDNMLIAGCDDKTWHKWDTSTLNLSEQLCNYLKRNMTREEWNQYVGNNMVYEKTCGTLP